METASSLKKVRVVNVLDIIIKILLNDRESNQHTRMTSTKEKRQNELILSVTLATKDTNFTCASNSEKKCRQRRR